MWRNICDQIRQMLENTGASQQEISEEIGVHATALSRAMRHGSDPSAAERKILLDAHRLLVEKQKAANTVIERQMKEAGLALEKAAALESMAL